MVDGVTDAVHPVRTLLDARRDDGSRPGARNDDARVALVIEGGGMRGAISAGMAIALEAHGFSDTFDDVYGTSAGALNGAWFVARAAQRGLPGWADQRFLDGSVRRRNVLRRRPVVDNEFIMDVVYEQHTPLPFQQIVDSTQQLHPIGTDAATGGAVDLAGWIDSVASLKLALRASAALPLLAGRPVELGGSLWFDGGLSESVPYRMAISQGATHVLVLRSRRRGEQEAPEQGRSVGLVARYLARHSQPLAEAFLARPGRLVSDDDELAAFEHASLEQGARSVPAVYSVRPAASTAPIARIERDLQRVQAGLDAGELALAEALGLVPAAA